MFRCVHIPIIFRVYAAEDAIASAAGCGGGDVDGGGGDDAMGGTNKRGKELRALEVEAFVAP